MLTSWAEEIDKVLTETGDARDVLTVKGPDGFQLHAKFDNGYGGSRGIPFVAWSARFVYFPVVYDGAEWVGYVPRNPTDEFNFQHFGGE